MIKDTEGIVLGIVLVEAGVLDNVCLFLPLFNDLEAHLDSVDDDGGEVLLNQKLGQSHAALHRLHEHDQLVEFEHVEKLEPFTDLFAMLLYKEEALLC